jgi:hypothetical protein
MESLYNFHILTEHLDIIKEFFHQLMHKCVVLKSNIKIFIKAAPACFGTVTPSSGSALFVLAKVTAVKIVH